MVSNFNLDKFLKNFMENKDSSKLERGLKDMCSCLGSI